MPPGINSVAVLVVGGGGGSAWDTSRGGNGGAVVYNAAIAVTPGASLSITVGAGGAGATSASGTTGGAGGASSFGSAATAAGGAGATGTLNGGTGAGGAGGADGTVTQGAVGGPGIAYSVFGSTLYGGGGGGGAYGGLGGAGGSGGGGRGGNAQSAAGTNGAANTGGGAGGAGYAGYFAPPSGGSGIVLVLGFFSQLPNVALGKTATLSAQLDVYAPAAATDGLFSTCDVASGSANGMTIADTGMGWLLIDLGAMYAISQVGLYGRSVTTFPEQSSNLAVRIGASAAAGGASNALCAAGVTAPSTGIALSCSLLGRYVSVLRETADYLSLCEVQAFGTPPSPPPPSPLPPPSPCRHRRQPHFRCISSPRAAHSSSHLASRRCRCW